MSRFTSSGKLRFPGIRKRKEPVRHKERYVVEECYCPNGHNLIAGKATFQGFGGILLKVRKKNGREGKIALSPVCGDKARVCLDVELVEGELLEISCPVCNAPLPIYSPCDCGGHMVTLFAEKNGDFSNCIGVCNRVGCPHAEIRRGDELFSMNRLKSL